MGGGVAGPSQRAPDDGSQSGGLLARGGDRARCTDTAPIPIPARPPAPYGAELCQTQIIGAAGSTLDSALEALARSDASVNFFHSTLGPNNTMEKVCIHLIQRSMLKTCIQSWFFCFVWTMFDMFTLHICVECRLWTSFKSGNVRTWPLQSTRPKTIISLVM